MKDPSEDAASLAPTAMPASEPRAIGVDATYWFAKFAANAFGTNLGDFWSDGLGLARCTSFGSLIAITAGAIWLDRKAGRRMEAGYWIAIVALRAAATNIGDFATHQLALGHAVGAIITGVVTLVAARLTRVDATGSPSPQVDLRYWAAMLIAGVFGTVSGDLASHMIGLLAASGALCLLLVRAIGASARLTPKSLVAYWGIVLAERCAGTPVGDWLASNRGAGLGLKLALVCTGALLAGGLLARGLAGRSRGQPGDRESFVPASP